MKEVKKIKLFYNNNEKSINIKNILIEKLDGLFEIVDSEFDLGVAIGGDGAFLRMMKSTNFDSNPYYIGVNAGTLGFAQEINIEEIDEFIDDLKNSNFKVENIGIQENKIVCDDVYEYYSINEIVVREKELNTAILNIDIDNVFLEEFVGDGVLVSTSFGSTAYNLSFGGSLVYNTFHTLQITPIAPLNNRSYRSLLNSIIIPENKIIKIVPREDKNNLVVTIDGENNFFDNVKYIETVVNKKRVKLLRRLDYDFAKKVNEKFLK